MRLLLILLLAVTQSFAGTWYGRLVDSKCYESEERNVSTKDSQFNVDRDQGLEIRLCAPKSTTKHFELVEPTGERIVLDSEGDAKAAELLQTAGWKHQFYVTATGEMTGNIAKVDSITPGE